MNAYVAFGDSQFIRRMFRSTFIYRPTICLPAHVNVDDFTVSSVGITAAPDDEVQLPKKTRYTVSVFTGREHGREHGRFTDSVERRP